MPNPLFPNNNGIDKKPLNEPRTILIVPSTLAQRERFDKVALPWLSR
jgi:hypothetical protein